MGLLILFADLCRPGDSPRPLQNLSALKIKDIPTSKTFSCNRLGCGNVIAPHLSSLPKPLRPCSMPLGDLPDRAGADGLAGSPGGTAANVWSGERRWWYWSEERRTAWFLPRLTLLALPPSLGHSQASLRHRLCSLRWRRLWLSAAQVLRGAGAGGPLLRNAIESVLSL